MAFGGRRANNRPSSCFSTFRAPPPLLRQEELNSHPFRVISDTRVNTQKGEGRLLIVWTRKQFLSLQSDFRVTVGGGERVGDIDGILHAHTFYTATPIILAITPTATLGAANREQSRSSVREATSVTSPFVGCGLKIRGKHCSKHQARAIGPCCAATCHCHPGMSR